MFVVLWPEFNHIRVRASNSTDVLGAVLPRPAMRCRRLSDECSTRPSHCPLAIFHLEFVSEPVAEWRDVKFTSAVGDLTVS